MTLTVPTPPGDAAKVPPVLELIDVVKTYAGTRRCRPWPVSPCGSRRGSWWRSWARPDRASQPCCTSWAPSNGPPAERSVSPGRTLRPCPTSRCQACGPAASGSCSSSSSSWTASPCWTTSPRACSTGAGGWPNGVGWPGRPIERVGLGHRVGHHPNQLSGGERQRTAIARALAGRPALVMADEPTGNLDTTTGASIVELLQELHEEGTTIVVITHDHEVAAAMERRIEIRDGRIIGDRPTGR